MISVTNVLAAVGLFPQDGPVLARAAEVARAHKAKLTVVHVIERLSVLELSSINLLQMQQQMENSSRALVEAAVASHVVARSELDIDIVIESGIPSQQISRIAKETHADLIVMRAHQKRSIIEKIIGSTTDRLIRTSTVPVLVVKRPATQEYQRIVVCVDRADKSSDPTMSVAALFPQALLNLTHAIYISAQFEALMLRAGSGTQTLSTHIKQLESQAKTHLFELAKALEPRPLRTITRVVYGDPAKTLVRATWNAKVDLIVLGPSSTSTIRQTLLGSVSRHVLHSAACDVLVCHHM